MLFVEGTAVEIQSGWKTGAFRVLFGRTPVVPIIHAQMQPEINIHALRLPQQQRRRIVAGIPGAAKILHESKLAQTLMTTELFHLLESIDDKGVCSRVRRIGRRIPTEADWIEIRVHRVAPQVAKVDLLETLGRERRVIVARHASVVVPHDSIVALQSVCWLTHRRLHLMLILSLRVSWSSPY